MYFKQKHVGLCLAKTLDDSRLFLSLTYANRNID
jgi:hypothetical protein